MRWTPSILAAACALGCGAEFTSEPTTDATATTVTTVASGGGNATTGGAGGGGASLTGGGGTSLGGTGGVMLTDCNTLADDFDDQQLAPKWMATGDAGVAVENGGRIEVALAPTAGSVGGVRSVAPYDLTECFLSIELEENLAVASGVEAAFGIFVNSNNWVSFFTPDDQLQTTVIIDGTLQNMNHVYEPTAHRYLRLVEQGGQLSYQASADGVTWSTLHSRPTPPFVSSAHITMGASNDVGNATPGNVRFDNLNL